MTRGVAHSPELRAEVIGAILAGATLSEAARRFGIDKSLASRWFASVAPNQRARDADSMAEMILELIADHVATLQAQLQATARAEWLAQQSAADLAALVAVERDTLIRLLAGLRPAETDIQPALDAPITPPETAAG